MKNIIEKIAKESGVRFRKVEEMCDEISYQLIREGCYKNDPRFLQYMIRRLRKRLKIEESTTFKTFKEFFNM
jgi:hypothetical protein